ILCCWLGRACSMPKRAIGSALWPSSFRRRWSPPIRARAPFPKAIRSRSGHPRARGRRCLPSSWRKPISCWLSAPTPPPPPFGPGVPADKTIIHSTNDAADINKEYRVDHAVVGDAALVLDAVIAEVGRQKGAGGGNALASLKEEVAAAKKEWLAEWGKHLDS